MIIFGQKTHQQINTESIKEILAQAKELESQLQSTPIDSILQVLHQVGQLWQQGGKYYQQALRELPTELSFSEEMIAESLKLIPDLLHKDHLKKRIELELGDSRQLDGFQFNFQYKQEHAFWPLGTVVHISAGNVFLGCIDSLLMGLITKNVSIIKLSSQNQLFPTLFAQSIFQADPQNIISDKYCMLYWKGGESEIETLVKQTVNGVLCWGGEESIRSWRQGASLHTRVLDYGPRISISVITRQGLEQADENFYDQLAKDASLWDQAACASAQVVYVQEGMDVAQFMQKLSDSMDRFELPRGDVDGNSSVETLKLYYRNLYHSEQHGILPIKGKQHTVVYDHQGQLSASSLNRTVVVKSFVDQYQLQELIAPFHYYQQTCALTCAVSERESYSTSLINAGVKRLCAAGNMLSSEIGAPHDGKMGLAELVKVINRDSIAANLDQFCQAVARTVPFYSSNLGRRLCEWPIISGKDVEAHGPGSLNPTMLNLNGQGQVFASGGTTGSPKFSYYSDQELEHISSLMGQSYQQLGLKPGEVVANLFVAANMWSSFTVVQMALQKCGVIQLPIGGQCAAEYIQDFFNRFKPTVVFGIPSMLADLSKQVQAKIHTVYFAGEMLTSGLKSIMQQNWGVQNFYSAGYASVDVGPIGYQVPGGEEGENYLFEGIHLEQIDGQAVVTSTLRTTMPIIRYQTGDLIEILQTAPRVKFKLMGRADRTIFIWSARIPLSDIHRACKNLGLESPRQVQVHFNQQLKEDELVIIASEFSKANQQQLAQSLFELCQDLKQTTEYSRVCRHLHLADHSQLIIQGRTGKCSELVDLRC